MCGEMGVPQSVYERYYKLKFGFKVDAPEEADLETNGQDAEDDVSLAL